MKVICISSGKEWIGGIDSDESAPELVVGNFYTVIDSDYYAGELYYFLEEIPPSVFEKYSYNSKLFALLSDEDEAELVNTKEEVYA